MRVIAGTAALAVGLAFAASAQTTRLPTLDGKPPLVIGHRGLPGLLPEETLPSYDLAAELGADALEMDLHLTKDCVLVARHNPWLSDNTNVAEVAKTHPEVAARKRTAPGATVKVAWAKTPASGPAEYPDRPHQSRRSQVGAEIARRRRRGPHQRLVGLRLHRRRTQAMVRRNHLRRPRRAPGRIQRPVPDPDLSGDRRYRQGEERKARPHDLRPIPKPRTRPGTTRRPSPTAAAPRAPGRWRMRCWRCSTRTASTARTRPSSCRASSPAA